MTELTMQLARSAGISDVELAHIHPGTLLHDIGKMRIPDTILLKEDHLTKEEQIPLSARLFAVADVWDALCSNRPYRRACQKPKCSHISTLNQDPILIPVQWSSFSSSWMIWGVRARCSNLCLERGLNSCEHGTRTRG